MKLPDDRGEAQWLERARQGDELAFTQLVEAYQVPVYNLCYRMLGDAVEAEDAAQESFIRAYRGLQRYDPQRKFSTWLLAVAAHHCIDRLRRRKAAVSLEALGPWEEAADPGPGPEAWLAVRQSREKIQALLQRLGPQDRSAIVMRYWYDYSNEEIAQTLSISAQAVKSRLHRARRQLAGAWVEVETRARGAEALDERASAL